MHPDDASGPAPGSPAPARPDADADIDADGAADGVITRFEVAAAAAAGAVVLRYRAAAHARSLRCTAAALRDALRDGDDAATVLFVPHDAPGEPAWIEATGAAVTLLPVTDAVKRVADGMVVATVDRTPLRYLVGPAAVDRQSIAALLAGIADGTIVHPLAVSPLRVLGGAP